MSSIKLYNKTGDEKAVAIQNAVEKQFGFVPQVFQAMGRNGDFLEAVLKIAEAAGKGLDPKTKELIIIACSAVFTPPPPPSLLGFCRPVGRLSRLRRVCCSKCRFAPVGYRRLLFMRTAALSHINPPQACPPTHTAASPPVSHEAKPLEPLRDRCSGA